jgi:hypothetical protein
MEEVTAPARAGCMDTNRYSFNKCTLGPEKGRLYTYKIRLVHPECVWQAVCLSA